MKKILTTILAGTLVAGAAFAADAKITLNFRSRLNAFDMMNGKNTKVNSETKVLEDEHNRHWMNWDNDKAYNGAGSDTFKFVLNGDRAGATFAVDLATVGTGKEGSFFTLNEYSGWMNFPVGPGTLTFRAGNWKNGYADGNYRVKKDHDAQNGEACDFERNKLGSILKGSQQLVYFDSLNAPANNSATAGFADYGFNVNDNVNLNILVGGVSKNLFDESVETDDGDTTTVTWNSAFVSRAQVKVKDVLNAELIYKLSHTADYPLYHTFGLYVMPQILDALTLNIGGAAEVFGGGGDKNNEKKYKPDYLDWGVDLRARYQVMDPLSITFFTNVSGTNYKNTKDSKTTTGRLLDKGVVGVKGGQGFATNHYFKVAMWNNLSARYKINDLLTATLNVGLVTPLSKGSDDDGKTEYSYSPEWRVTPAVQIYAASNASLWAGVAISGSSWTSEANNKKTDYSVLCVEIPVIFRVKM